MKIGLYGINTGACAEPQTAIRVARAAEDAGFESLWTAEHIVLPDPQVPPSPAPPELAFLDPAVALSFIAAKTRNIRIATGIVILPQRNPVELAKQLASLDIVSNGRLIFGLGAGYLEPEFRALGADFENRGARTDEYIEVLKTLWTQEKPQFEGSFCQFGGIQSQPQPLQKPHPPIIIGGQSPPAYRRAVLRGNGWYGFALDIEATRKALAGLSEAATKIDRPAKLGALSLTITPVGPIDIDQVRRYEDLGVERLVLLAFGKEDAQVAFVEKTGNELVRAG
ncbi:MAG: LLM class F420-dependent oxidoreductase [bacterium]|nr:LLM class F420-dependent oxidoreductase [bacterium]